MFRWLRMSWFKRILAGLPASLLVTGLLGVAAPALADDARLLVQPRPGFSEARLDTLLRGMGASRTGRIEAINVVQLRVPEHARDRVLAALQRNPHISFAEPDRLVPLQAVTPNDPYYDDAWHLPKIEAPTAWETARGDAQVVAVLDTGVDPDHPELSGKLVSGHNSASGDGDTSDVNGHGTQVAGVVGAASDNGEGVASLAWESAIMPVRVTDRSDGAAYFSDIADGLIWAADNGAHAANISYNVSGSSTVKSAAKHMMDAGGLTVVAAGNNGEDPGYDDSAYMIAVSATDSSDTLTSWSNYGTYIDVAAPGVDIWTTRDGGDYGAPSGTSFSSPITAGVIALMTGVNGSLAPADVEGLLEDSAVDLGLEGQDTFYGHGRVDAAAAVAAMEDASSSDTESPTVSIVAPSDGAEVSGVVAVDVDASDNTGVSKVELRVNGTLVATDEAEPWGFSWDSETVSDGDVTLTATAYDDAGNAADHQITVTVANSSGSNDDEAPTVTITSPSDGDSVSGHVDINATAEDDNGIAVLSVFVDGKLLCSGDSASISCRWKSRKADAGDHTITAEAEDSAGNVGSDAITVSTSGKGNNGKGGGSSR